MGLIVGVLTAVILLATVFAVFAESGLDLLDGELLVRLDGVYTKIHHYADAENKRRVTLIGTVHQAEEQYFRGIGVLLDSCEVVIFEGPSNNKISDAHQELNERNWLFLLFDGDINRAAAAALIVPLGKEVSAKLGYVNEFTYYDFSRKGWISGDEQWYRKRDQEGWDKFWDAKFKLIKALPKAVKTEIIRKRRELLAIPRDKINRNDILDFTILVHDRYSESLEPVFNFLTRERDEISMGVFDEIVMRKNPSSICIKFGAYHLRYQRRLLEDRGYLKVHLEELKAISLP